MLMVYCSLMVGHNPAVYISLNASHNIQSHQGPKSYENETDIHDICVFCAHLVH